MTINKFLLSMVLLCHVSLSGETSWKASAPGGFSVDFEISKTTITLEDHLVLHLSLNYPAGYHPDLHLLLANLLDPHQFGVIPFRLISEEISPTKTTSDISINEITYVLDPQIPGNFYITFAKINFIPDKNGKNVELISEITRVTVEPLKENPPLSNVSAPLLPLTPEIPIRISARNKEDFIKNPSLIERERLRTLKITKERIIPWGKIAAAFVFAILCLFLLFFMRQKKAVSAAKREKGVRENALGGLLHLEEKGLPSQNRFDEFYVELTEIVRHFIEERFQIKATTQTTEEFLHEIATNPQFNEKTQSLISAFLESADRVKFSKYSPTLEESQAADEAARRVINL